MVSYTVTPHWMVSKCIYQLNGSILECVLVGRGLLVCRRLRPWADALRLGIRLPSAQLFSGTTLLFPLYLSFPIFDTFIRAPLLNVTVVLRRFVCVCVCVYVISVVCNPL